MFAITSTDYAPWNIINSDNKLSAHLSSIHLVLDKFDYPKKDQIYLGEVTRVDELDKMGALRETSEETGLNIDYLKVTESLGKIEYIRKYDGVDYKKIVYWFKMDYALGTEVDLVPDEGEGIECCKWIKTSSISQLKTRKYLKKFVELNFHPNT